jgi:YVTN family beta-propeller protein
MALSLLTRASSPLIAVSAVGRMPSAIAVDPRSGHIFVANSADNTVTILDTRTGRVLDVIGVGDNPNQLQVNPRTARAFVFNAADGSVSVLDTRSGAVLRTLRLGPVPAPALDQQNGATFVFQGRTGGHSSVAVPSPSQGEIGLVAVQDGPGGTWLQSITSSQTVPGFAVDGAAGRLFVPDGVGQSVSLFDAARGQYLRSVRVGAHPVAVAVDPRTRRAFVASLGPLLPVGAPSSLSVLDSTSGRVLRTVVVGHYPALVAVDVAGGRVLVVHRWGGTGDARADSQGLGGGATDVLDARSGRLLATLATGAVAPELLPPGVQASLVAVDERRGHAFVLERGADEPATGRVRVVDDRKMRVLGSVAVAPFPIALAVDAPANRLFVLHAYSDCHVRSSAWAAVPASVRRWLPFLPPPQTPGQAQPACADHGSVSVFDLARL